MDEDMTGSSQKKNSHPMRSKNPHKQIDFCQRCGVQGLSTALTQTTRRLAESDLNAASSARRFFPMSYDLSAEAANPP
jgi:hypothetical protein